MSKVLTKLKFAERVNVSPSCVSQWIARGKISGDALIGSGNRARIRVGIAVSQLEKTLDIDSRLGTNGKARLEPLKAVADDEEETIENRIKAARWRQIELSNEKAEAEAAARAGRYMLADDARREMGRIASRLVTMFESALPELANALAPGDREALARL